jgi:putative selenium metabolism protein SsnA
MLIVGNGTVITRDKNNTVIPDGCVAIRDNIITDVGTTAELTSRYKDAQFVDAEKKLIMPGLINTHMHFYSTFARGMSTDSPPPSNFMEILEGLWWRLDKVLTPEDVYYSALVPIIDCIKNGVTTVFDHHASPYAATGSLYKIAEATKKAGLRSCLCYEVSERDGVEILNSGIRENSDFLKSCSKQNDPMTKAMFGLHASVTLSDKALEKCVRENEGSGAGFHIHVAEGIQDLEDARAKYGCGVVERLNKRGILGGKTIAAHCIHISEAEIDILKETGTNVVHNPESNMGNAVGVSPVLKMFEKGVLPGMGTDGYTSDMFESLKAANCLHKHASKNPSAAWGEPPAMLFNSNRNIAAGYFEKPLGVLETGAYADLIVADYDPPTPLLPENVNSHMLFGLTGRAVDTTIINGQVVMKDRKLTTLDEREVCAKSRELAEKLWKRI